MSLQWIDYIILLILTFSVLICLFRLIFYDFVTRLISLRYFFRWAFFHILKFILAFTLKYNKKSTNSIWCLIILIIFFQNNNFFFYTMKASLIIIDWFPLLKSVQYFSLFLLLFLIFLSLFLLLTSLNDCLILLCFYPLVWLVKVIYFITFYGLGSFAKVLIVKLFIRFYSL